MPHLKVQRGALVDANGNQHTAPLSLLTRNRAAASGLRYFGTVTQPSCGFGSPPVATTRWRSRMTDSASVTTGAQAIVVAR
jgi:hypothetical protein